MADDAPPTRGASSATDLADLLKACGKGDQAAFAQLYDATSSRVVGLAVRVVRDPAQAEEVAQEAFLEIWKNSGRFDPAKGSPLGWLLTIVHRKAVDRVRSAEASTRRDTTYHQQNQPVEHDSTAEAAHGLTGGAAGPRGPGQPHPGAARGTRARVLRRLHAHGGGDHARATGRHRQDPDQGRTHQTSRHHGGGLDFPTKLRRERCAPRARTSAGTPECAMTGDIHALSGRLRRRRARRHRARPVRAAPGRVPGLHQRGRLAARGVVAAGRDHDRHPLRRAPRAGCCPGSATSGRSRRSSVSAMRPKPPSSTWSLAGGAASSPFLRPPQRPSRSGPGGSSGSS